MKSCHSIFIAVMTVVAALYISSWVAAQPQVDAYTDTGTQAEAVTDVPKELSPSKKIQDETAAKLTNPDEEIRAEKAIEQKAVAARAEKTVGDAATQGMPHRSGTKGNVKVDRNSLISITDGSFRYERIPGITIKDDAVQPAVMPEETADVQDEGIFGLSTRTSDILAKIVLAVIVIIVFILYRMRTRNTSGSVLRRFPK